MKPYTAADFQAAMQEPNPRVVELRVLRARMEPVAELLAQHQPLTGVLFTEHGPMEADEAAVVFGVGRVVYRFGTWAVTEEGVACLVHHYPLTRAQLQQPRDWASYLAELSWVNLWDLLRALVVEAHTRRSHHDDGPHGDGASPT